MAGICILGGTSVVGFNPVKSAAALATNTVKMHWDR